MTFNRSDRYINHLIAENIRLNDQNVELDRRNRDLERGLYGLEDANTLDKRLNIIFYFLVFLAVVFVFSSFTFHILNGTSTSPGNVFEHTFIDQSIDMELNRSYYM
jgi:hypothetical protein